MQRKISIGGRSFGIQVLSQAADGHVRFRVDGADESTASVIEVTPRVYSVLLNERSLEARIISDNGDTVVEIDGQRYAVTVEDPRRSRPQRGIVSGEGRVTAPMPGKVVRVLVAPGETVTAGQGLVVIEAMKMQNELKAPRDGRVASLAVHEGQTVTAGAVLAVVE